MIIAEAKRERHPIFYSLEFPYAIAFAKFMTHGAHCANAADGAPNDGRLSAILDCLATDLERQAGSLYAVHRAKNAHFVTIPQSGSGTKMHPLMMERGVILSFSNRFCRV